jgi:hypothetical protein
VAVVRSLATYGGLFRDEVSLRQMDAANPKLAPNRISGWHTLYPQNQQFRIRASVKRSRNLLPQICVFELVAGKVSCSSKPVREQEAWPTRTH